MKLISENLTDIQKSLNEHMTACKKQKEEKK
jgi:hypothetical protein